ncbi:uncharacterized protein LOC128395926 [Panonychus citri]|uniref:uncharacterized protein LOC128395926 n=1 Tax=Panonychus citri TaxID=50023 RepID=UPI0023080050|nr:uncharacterized protein LOC128395926 [Panonychus citri]
MTTMGGKAKESTPDSVGSTQPKKDGILERMNVGTKENANEDVNRNDTPNGKLEGSTKFDSNQIDSSVGLNVASLNTIVVPEVQKDYQINNDSTSLKSNGGNTETHSIMNNSTSEESTTEDEENCEESADEETTTISAIETHQPTKVSEQKDQKGSSNVQPSQQNSQTIGSTINSGILASGILLENESPSLSQMSTSNLQKAPVSENNN